MIWILFVLTYKGGVGFAEFSTEAACESARYAITAAHKEKQAAGWGPLIIGCTKK